MMSSYAKAIQNQQGFTGSLFQQRTEAKQVSSEWLWQDYSLYCFRYILYNPVAAKLVSEPKDWEFSSYRDLAGIRKGTLCNRNLIRQELNIEWDVLEALVNRPLTEVEIGKIF